MSDSFTRSQIDGATPFSYERGKRLVPTPRALELKGRIQALADEARSIVQSRQAISLAEMERTFTIRADESLAGVVATTIMAN